MTPGDIALIIAAIGGLAGVGSMVTALFNRKKIYAEAGKSGADSAQVLSAASVALLEPMQIQMARLSANLIESQNRVDSLDTKLTATNTKLRKTNEELDSARYQIRLLSKNVDDLSGQLGRYQDRYGPLPADGA